MTDGEARALMERHGITTAERVVYHYKGFNYGSLADALNYAELVTSADKRAARKRSDDKRNDRT